MKTRDLRRAALAAGLLAAVPLAAGCLGNAEGREQPPPGASAVGVDETTAPDLAQRIDSIARSVGATAGVAARALRSGARFELRGDERFPMASVYKLPIALAVLHRVDEGTLRPDSPITIPEADFAPHFSPLADSAAGPVTLSVDSLLALMLGGSDNTASDALLRAAGGAAAVTARLRELGVEGVRVDRSERELGLDLRGVGPWPEDLPWSRARFDSVAAAVPEAERRTAAERFLADPRDTSTPAGMVELLARIGAGGAASPASLRRLRAIMAATTVGGRRIPAGVPPGSAVLHKTGTTPSVTNDVGLVTTPGGGEVLALAVFLKGSARPVAQRERAVAEIARAVTERLLPGESAACVAPDARVALDHVVVAVADLEAAAGSYRRAGFTLKPGRPHANGLLNAHVKFGDGTELELMSVPEPATDAIARGYRDFLAGGEGGAFVAFRAADDDVLRDARRAGVRADSLGSAYVVFPDLPRVFVLRPGQPRVSDTDSLLTHANGAGGAAEAWLEGDRALADLLQALGARECGPVEAPDVAGMTASGRAFAVANARVVLTPAAAPERPMVIGVALLGAPDTPPIPARRAHGVWLRFVDR